MSTERFHAIDLDDMIARLDALACVARARRAADASLLAAAELCGGIAFRAGKRCAPSLDPDVRQLVDVYEREIPHGSHSALLERWGHGWKLARERAARETP